MSYILALRRALRKNKAQPIEFLWDWGHTGQMDPKKFIQQLKGSSVKKKVMINIRVDEDVRAALLEFARKNNVTATAVVEKLLRDLLSLK